jgi:hypothetical protein
VLTRVEIIFDFDLVGVGDWRLGHIPGDDDTRDQEHGTAILAAPIAGRKLQLGEEFETIFGGLEGCFWVRKIGLFLSSVRDCPIGGCWA